MTTTTKPKTVAFDNRIHVTMKGFFKLEILHQTAYAAIRRMERAGNLTPLGRYKVLGTKGLAPRFYKRKDMERVLDEIESHSGALVDAVPSDCETYEGALTRLRMAKLPMRDTRDLAADLTEKKLAILLRLANAPVACNYLPIGNEMERKYTAFKAFKQAHVDIVVSAIAKARREIAKSNPETQKGRLS